MSRTRVTSELVEQMTELRREGLTLEQVGFECHVSTETVRRYTPKGIDHHTRGIKGNSANAQIHDTQHLDPLARIVRPSVQRAFR